LMILLIHIFVAEEWANMGNIPNRHPPGA